LNIVGPYLSGKIIDEYIIKRDLNGLTTMSLVLVATYTGLWLTQTLYGRQMAKVAQKVTYKLRKDLFEHLQTLSMNFFDKESAGDLMSRLTNDMDNINTLVSQNLVTFLSSLLTLVGIVIMMFMLNVWMAVASLVIFPIILTVMSRMMDNMGSAFRTQQKDLGKLNGMMEENLSGQQVIIANNQQENTVDKFETLNSKSRESSIIAQTFAGVMAPLMMGLGNLNLVFVVAVGGLLVINEFAGITVGLITTYSTYARRMNQPVMQISQLFNSIIAALSGAERIFEILDTEPIVKDKTDAVELDTIKGSVVFSEVDFGYEKNVPVLKDINLNAKPGQMIALVGPTGAGKTTIINVLSRFYDINGGTILIDGNEIRDVYQDDLRQQLGIVLQSTYLFSNTILENIRYGRLDATDEEVIKAADLAYSDHFIRRLPMGYDTMLSERACNLSQGQRQLLAIARAILADPQILILDEATSSVDTRTEKLIQKGIRNLLKGKTSFVIAHRLSTIQAADQILVIVDGSIVENGTHEDLLSMDSLYHELYSSQFKGLEVPI
jgi:ATP-binding cassette subfamily B protein